MTLRWRTSRSGGCLEQTQFRRLGQGHAIFGIEDDPGESLTRHRRLEPSAKLPEHQPGNLLLARVCAKTPPRPRGRRDCGCSVRGRRVFPAAKSPVRRRTPPDPEWADPEWADPGARPDRGRPAERPNGSAYRVFLVIFVHAAASGKMGFRRPVCQATAPTDIHAVKATATHRFVLDGRVARMLPIGTA